MTVLSPVTFSPMKLCPSFFAKNCAPTRAAPSAGPPAGYGTIRVTVRIGYCCASVCATSANRQATATATAAIRLSTDSSHLLFWESLRRRNDWQQEVWLPAAGEMQCVTAIENLWSPVVLVDMEERPDAFHRIGGVRQSGVAAVDFVVLAAHR